MLNTRLDRVMRDLRKARRFVRLIVVIGITASVAANVLGAEDIIAAVISGWPPFALLLSLEVLTRVPTSKRLGAFGRVVATLGVAGAAGWLSYWHMAATVSQHGERGGSQYIWPVSVDGLMTIAAIALVELGARLRVLEAQQEEREALKDGLTVTPPQAVTVAATAPVVAAAEAVTAAALPVPPAKSVPRQRKPYGGRSGPNQDEYADRSMRPSRLQQRAAK